MPEIISTPNALVQTVNGKRFYVFSKLISVTTAETSLIDIDNIGERDIKIYITLGSSYDTTLGQFRVYSNGEVVYFQEVDNWHQSFQYGSNELRLILPGNTSLKITAELNGGDSLMLIAAHGKYLSM